MINDIAKNILLTINFRIKSYRYSL